MSDSGRPLNRLLQQPSSLLERAILRTGVDATVSTATRDAVLDALGLEQKPLALAPVRRLPWRKSALLLAALVVSTVAVAIPIARQASVEAPPLTSSEATGTRVTGAGLKGQGSPLAPASTPVDVAPERDKADKQRPRTESNRGVDENTAVHSSTARSSGRNALAAELAALDAARNRLNAGEPQLALNLLDTYYRDFPKPRLLLEAEVLSIDALDRAGQTESARRRAVAFVRNHPKGVLTGRVRRYLEQ